MGGADAAAFDSGGIQVRARMPAAPKSYSISNHFSIYPISEVLRGAVPQTLMSVDVKRAVALQKDSCWRCRKDSCKEHYQPCP